MTDAPFVDATYAKSGAYSAVLADIIKTGVCPFCRQYFSWHPHPVLASSANWFVTRSMQPYDNAAEHYLIIAISHMEQLTDLSGADMVEVHDLATAVAGDEGGGALLLRFGDTKWTGATVRHLHFHVVVPEIDPTTSRAKVVNFPIG